MKQLDLKYLVKHPDKKISQAAFARFINCDPAVICRLVGKGILDPEGSWKTWEIQACAYWKGVAAGRNGSGLY